ncbi:MAG: helix-turn-helix domain-containing protein [Candidatus Poribacteria bacterium]
MGTIASLVKRRRRELKITQTELARVANLTPAAISQFESGARKPSFDTLFNLADALKVTTDYLLGKKERGYDDLLADPKVSIMFRGIMKLPEEDKTTMFEFYEFLKNKNEKSENADRNEALEG